MIIKGSAGGKGGHAGALARHLMRTDENSRVEILELDPAAPADNLKAVLNEFQMLAAANTKGERGFYQASLNPEIEDRSLTEEEWKKAADILEAKLGFENLPRAIVLHEKDGREHIHVVWQRYDIESGKLRPYSHNYKAHVEAARDIEQALDLNHFQDIVQDRSYDFDQTQKSNRTDLTPPERKELVTELFNQADSSKAFIAALDEAGFDLARGDKPNTFVLIDAHGEVHALHRQITGLKKAEIHERMLPAKPEQFKTVGEIKAEQGRAIDASDLPDADEARAEIESQFAQERLALEARHKLERENLSRRFEADNLKVRESRGVAKQSVHWHRQDQRRLANQTIEHDRLLKQQSNETAKLQRAENRALRDHDRRQKGQDPKHILTQEDRLLKGLRHALHKLNLDDRSANSPVARHTKALEKLQQQKQADERRLTTFQYHTEQSMAVFRKCFENADDAYEAFRAQARDKGLKHAQNELLRRPAQFGEVKNAALGAMIEDAAKSFSNIHYTEKKMFEVRLRADDGLLQPSQLEQAMAEHGIAGSSWQHYARAQQNNLAARIEGQSRALEQAIEYPDGRRLALMAEAHSASAKLDKDTYRRLDHDEKTALRAIGECLKKPENAERLRALEEARARNQQEPWRSQEDPRRYQYYQK